MWLFVFFFFFKQKTAYEMRISDWSSDVCSSDLVPVGSHRPAPPVPRDAGPDRRRDPCPHLPRRNRRRTRSRGSGRGRRVAYRCGGDRKSVVSGKSVSVSVDLGGRRIIKKKIKDNIENIYNSILIAIQQCI